MSNELPIAFISHRVPGRVRIRIPAMQHQDQYFERLRERLATVPGLHRLTTNTRTSSVLLEFKGELEGAALDELGQRLELFQLGARPHPHSLSEFLHVATTAPDEFLKKVTDGRVDVAGLTALALTGMGISQIVRGHALPAGWTLLWNATNLVRDVGGKPEE
ncbi:MAG: hypothetical protein RL701_2460 [Pseudomonadota bacterium]